MRIIAYKNIEQFGQKYPDSKKQLMAWYAITKASKWQNVNEVKQTFPFVRIFLDNRVVFNIKGNEYRLIVKFNFKAAIGYICFVGTHAEYNEINAETIWLY
jgi:mRNA interferase HigB